MSPIEGAVNVGCQWTASVSGLIKLQKNLICGDLEIPLVVIQLGVPGLKKARLLYLLDLFGERGEEGWCDLVCVKHL